VAAHPDAFRPPNAPWREVAPQANAGAYVSVYLSSTTGRLPVRDVLRLGDNKSDPNLETSTYGLFSTCEPTMRRSIVARGITEIFFVTTIDPIGRALVGRYELGWLAEVDPGDYAYAASAARFVDPIPVSQMTGRLGTEMQKKLRNYKIVDERIAASLRGLIDAAPDRTSDYLFEIDRLERMSLSRTGFRYPTWDGVEGFSWSGAGPYLAGSQHSVASPNTSPTGAWQCAACGAEIRNDARLKVCNVCRKRGTLRPVGGAK
jgi:hypothetical protein